MSIQLQRRQSLFTSQFLRPKKRWIDRGLVYASPLGPTANIAWPPRANAITGTKLIAVNGRLGRGFGSTYGAGSTDRIVTGLTSHATQRTYLMTAIIAGIGGGTFGRLFEKRVSDTNQIELFAVWAAPALQYQRLWSGGANYARWDFTFSSAPRKLAVTYDASNTNNYPRLCIDGQFQVRVSDFVGSSGSPVTNADAYVIGNRATDNARNLDGAIWDFAVFDSILSDDEILELQFDPSTLWEEQRIWVPMAGTPPSYTHPTLSNPRMDPLTASGGIPKVDWAFA